MVSSAPVASLPVLGVKLTPLSALAEVVALAALPLLRWLAPSMRRFMRAGARGGAADGTSPWCRAGSTGLPCCMCACTACARACPGAGDAGRASGVRRASGAVGDTCGDGARGIKRGVWDSTVGMLSPLLPVACKTSSHADA